MTNKLYPTFCLKSSAEIERLLAQLIQKLQTGQLSHNKQGSINVDSFTIKELCLFKFLFATDRVNMRDIIYLGGLGNHNACGTNNEIYRQPFGSVREHSILIDRMLVAQQRFQATNIANRMNQTKIDFVVN